jgi:hypothetical protein
LDFAKRTEDHQSQIYWTYSHQRIKLFSRSR